MSSPAQPKPWQFTRKRPKLAWQRAVLAFACPECTAGPGDWCHSKSGKRKHEPHSDRARLASANNWKDPDEREG